MTLLETLRSIDIVNFFIKPKEQEETELPEPLGYCFLCKQPIFNKTEWWAREGICCNCVETVNSSA